jgi:hypothetical protein
VKWWLLLLLVALVGGELSERPIAPARNERAGRRVVQADLHVHTRLSDGFLSPFEVVLRARAHGLDAIALTEHNSVLPAKVARWFSRRIDGPLVLLGEEVTTNRYHLLVYGIEHTVRPRRDLGAVLDDVHRQGGVAIAAHPNKRYWPALEAHADALDGSEVMHPSAFMSAGSFRHDEMVSFYQRHGGTAVGTSDYHFLKTLGAGRTLLFVDGLDEHSLLAALRAGRTVVELPDGRRFSSAPKLRAAIEREPLPAHDRGLSYEPAGWFDGITRLLGWLGLMGLLLLRRDE